MKIYVKAATDNSLLACIKNHGGSVIKDKINISFTFVSSNGLAYDYDGDIPEDTILNFTNAVFNCVNDNITIDRDLFQFKLVIFVEDNGDLSSWLQSNYLSGSHRRNGYGGHSENNPHTCANSSHYIPQEWLNEFAEEVRDYCKDLSKISNKSDKIFNKYPDITNDVIKAAYLFNYWIVKEGRSSYGQVASRTINNPNSGYFEKEKYASLLNNLFDYAKQHNYSYEDLKALCKDCTFLSTRLKSLGAV